MDAVIQAIIAQGGSLWLLLAYILIKDVAPKFFPGIAKAISKRVTVEDRLFSVIDRSNSCSTEIAKALVELSHALETLNDRVLQIENVIVLERRAKLIIPPTLE